MADRRYLLSFLVSILISSSAFAQSNIDEAAYSLQSRRYQMKHEFFIAPGLLPLDAFEKAIVGNVSYTYHLNEGWAFEFAQFAYAWNVDTGLQGDLRRLFGAQAVIRDSLKYFGSANVVLKPIYRKMILFNRTILHGETFFVMGAGPFKMQSGFKPAVDLGIGFRIYINDWASIRFDGRDYIWFDGTNPNNVLMLAMGVSFNLQGD